MDPKPEPHPPAPPFPGSLPPVNFDVRQVINATDEVAKVCALFRDTMPESPLWREDYIRWLYFDNPAGTIIGANAWDGSNLAAHYVVLPIRAAVKGTPVEAALSLNTATHPNYQRRGLFVRLAEATYDMARAKGLHHIIGVANANSTPGFLTKLKFQDVGPLSAVMSLGMPTVGPEPEPASVSWRRAWQERDLAWRLRNPATVYRSLQMGEHMAVLAPTGVLGIQAVLLIEDDAARARIIREGLGSLLSFAPRLWIGLSRRIRPAAASLDVPERFRKSPLNLIFRPLKDPGITLDKATVEFEAIDFDAY